MSTPFAAAKSFQFDTSYVDGEMNRALASSKMRKRNKKTNAQHSANVEAAEMERASRPPIGSRTLSTRRGSISRPEARPTANDAGRTSGRGYYHPERIAERSMKRRERIDRQRFGS